MTILASCVLLETIGMSATILEANSLMYGVYTFHFQNCPKLASPIVVCQSLKRMGDKIVSVNFSGVKMRGSGYKRFPKAFYHDVRYTPN